LVLVLSLVVGLIEEVFGRLLPLLLLLLLVVLALLALALLGLEGTLTGLAERVLLLLVLLLFGGTVFDFGRGSLFLFSV
jgi:hypothetical protein